MKPILIVSDLHFHNWSAFSTVDDGVNSRLQAILDAFEEACKDLIYRGGESVILAGDLFHKRGNIEPSVLNPVMDLFRKLWRMGLRFHAIPGNHDLTTNDSQRISSAVTALEEFVVVCNEPAQVFLDGRVIYFFPWYSKTADLISAMKEYSPKSKEGTIAIIHAPVDGVLPHLEGHGINPEALSDLGFDFVFSGHYHNHKQVAAGVYSVGALTNQHWGDVGSKAGYIILDDEGVTHIETDHPKFVSLDEVEDEEGMIATCDGNYVRLKIEVSTEAEIAEMRDGLLAFGAKGAQIIPVKKTVTTREGVVADASAVKLEESITSFLKKKGAPSSAIDLALEVLNEARSI